MHSPLTLPTHLLFVILLMHCFVFSSQQGCNKHDQYALLAFSANISTPFSIPLNWSSSISCCLWEGIECDVNGRVIHLQLPLRGLKGVISSSVTSLVMLRIIDLSSNSILGSIPTEIGKLLYLEKLYLYENNLTSYIPSSLMNCTHLVEILLRDNHLSGDISKIDFSGLLQLQKLDLRNNSLNGSLPESIYSCKSLVAIGIAINNITGQISPKIIELKSLSFLSLAKNSFTNITGTLRILAKCKNLTTIFLSFSFYNETLPVHKNFISSTEFPKLQFFYLHDCKFSMGPVPNWISTLKKLRVLSLQGNRMTGRVPSWLGTLKNLSRLELNNNSLFGEFPLKLCHLSALISQDNESYLELFQFELPIFYILSNGNTHVRFKASFYHGLDLSHNALSGNIPKEIGNLQSIQELDLNNNRFFGHIPISMSNLTRLERLNLSTNNLTGEIPTSLVDLSFLSRFDVSRNNLEGFIPTGGQFLTFEESSFEGNPGLCGKPLKHLCYNQTTPTTRDGRRSGHEHSQPFLDGLFVGCASGFCGILIILASYICFNYCKRRRLP